MPSFNSVVLLGNITCDIETRYTPSGTAIADVGLAINRSWKNDRGEKQDETTFVDVTLFGKTAEVAAEYCRKGDPLFVSGRLRLDTWDDRQTGQKRSKLKVVGEAIQLLGGKPRAASPAQPSAAPPPARTPPVSKTPPGRDELDPEPSGQPF